MNDTSCELGGTLGVAVVGSVFASVHGLNLVDALRGMPIPGAGPRQRPRVDGRGVHRCRSGTRRAQPIIIAAAREAFVDGLAFGSLAAAGVAALGAIAVLKFLPAKAPQPATAELRPAERADAGLPDRAGEVLLPARRLPVGVPQGSRAPEIA